MFYQKLHIIIALVAGVISAVISIINGDSLYAYSFKLAIVVTIFYIIGRLIKAYLDKRIFNKDDENNAEKVETETETTDEDE